MTLNPTDLHLGDWVWTTIAVQSPRIPLRQIGEVVRMNGGLGVQFVGTKLPINTVRQYTAEADAPIWEVVEKLSDEVYPLAMMYRETRRDLATERGINVNLHQSATLADERAVEYSHAAMIDLPKANAEVTRLKAQLEAVREANALLAAEQKPAPAPTADEQIEVRYFEGGFTFSKTASDLAELRNDGWVVVHEEFDFAEDWHHARLERRVKKAAGEPEPKGKKLLLDLSFFSKPDDKPAEEAAPQPDAQPAEPPPPPAAEPEKAVAQSRYAMPEAGFVRVFFCGGEGGTKTKYRYLLGFDHTGKLLPLVFFKEQITALNTAGYGNSDFAQPGNTFTCAYDVVLADAKLPYEGGWRVSKVAPKPVINQWHFMKITQDTVLRLHKLDAEGYRVALDEAVQDAKQAERDASSQYAQPSTYIRNPHVTKPAQPVTVFGLPDSPPLPEAAPKYASRAEQIKAESDARIAEAVAPFLNAVPTSTPKESLSDFMKRRAAEQKATA